MIGAKKSLFGPIKTKRRFSPLILLVSHIIHKEAQHASLNPMKEMSGLVPNSQSRQADVYIANWVEGRKMAFDVSVVSPTRDAILHHAADSAAAAIEIATIAAPKASFSSLLLLTFVGLDMDAVKYLKDIARLEARRWAKNDAIEIKQFFQRLLIALHREMQLS